MCFKENGKNAEGMFGNMLNTTALACIKENRHFIGMELNEEYYEKAMKRIKKEREEIENSLFNMLN